MLLCLLIIALAFMYWREKHGDEPFYATMQNYNPSANEALFTNPSRYCQGGPYMTSGNPQKTALCSRLAETGQLTGCSPGFKGAPIGFAYYDSNLYGQGI